MTLMVMGALLCVQYKGAFIASKTTMGHFGRVAARLCVLMGPVTHRKTDRALKCVMTAIHKMVMAVLLPVLLRMGTYVLGRGANKVLNLVALRWNVETGTERLVVRCL